MDYKSVGVDIEAGYRSVELIKGFVESTKREEVIGSLGGFSGAFDLGKIKGMDEPVLLSGTDGVGTKIKIAFILDRHDTVGIDCVAMCVNDISCAGGQPLFFLDYIACGKNIPEKIAKIVEGVAEGCKMAGAALIGGETAEHPGLMPEDEYDLAGFAVGIADKKDIIDGKTIKDGDTLIGIASSGVHSNGFSLVRKVFSMKEENLNRYYDSLGASLGDTLLTPTKIYTKALKSVKDAGFNIKGCSHITGGGFFENIPRMLPEGIEAEVKKDSYPVPPIFDMIQKDGGIEGHMMYNTFNMGLGMVLAVDPKDAEGVINAIGSAGEKAYIVGSVFDKGEKGVRLC
ncbi:MAG: phosphoribosylformylglycinamidine cyclo-ligase [Lachnospiraceae bacterium]|nr:phosphoribosylformylglycinamidine cyclo-ligase [Lachnospiraceae bacterium]